MLLIKKSLLSEDVAKQMELHGLRPPRHYRFPKIQVSLQPTLSALLWLQKYTANEMGPSGHCLLVTGTGWYCTKRPKTCGHFLIYCVPMWVLIIPESSTSLANINRHLVAIEGKTLREMFVNFAGEISLSYSTGIFNMPSNLSSWGRRLYFSSEGSHATDFYHPWPGLNPRTLCSMASTMTTRAMRTT
jgi:hypothetical protein